LKKIGEAVKSIWIFEKVSWFCIGFRIDIASENIVPSGKCRIWYQFKDVEEVLMIKQTFRRKVIWAPVPLEQVKADQENVRSMTSLKNLISKEIRLL
jgi:hypothetical protein